MQRSVGYNPQPPFGCMDYDHLEAVSATARAGSSRAAPLLAAGPKRLTRQSRGNRAYFT